MNNVDGSLKSTNHKNNIRSQLVKVGVTPYGLLKGEARHLHSIVHGNEEIHGAVYGRTDDGSAMIVATDKRILYLDHRILFSKSEVITYEVVSGVTIKELSGYAGVVLHTRIRDFRLRFVNINCARIFGKYIESRCILTNMNLPESLASEKHIPVFNVDRIVQKEFSKKVETFLISNDTAVLSTVTANLTVQGSVVFYVVDNNNLIYIVTKTKTAKSYNITNNPSVAVTIFDKDKMQTLQIEGVAFIETDPNISKEVYRKLLLPHKKNGTSIISPLFRMPAGEYELIVVKTQHYKYADYGQKEIDKIN